MEKSTKIRVEQLTKIFGDSPQAAIELLQSGASKDDILRETGNVLAVANVSFSVDEGEIFMVMGLSGSGKSTLVRCINRLISATSGSVYIDDEDVLKVDEERLRQLRRAKMSMVFQHFALLPHKTVVENVEYGLKVRGMKPNERRQKAMGSLEMVGLREWYYRYPENLSGGMQQRVGLARALATDPDILLMDEAFSALDPLIRGEMQDELIALQQKVQKTILFITHDFQEALKLGDRIAVMKDGGIVQLGLPEEVVSAPADDYVAAFTHDVDRSRFLTACSIMKPAEVLQQGRHTMLTAMNQMKALGTESLFVVDGRGKPVGVVLARDMVRAVEEGSRDLDKVMRTGFPTAAENMHIAEIYRVLSAGLPTAVVDDNGRLQGVLNPLDVLEGLVGGSAAPETEDDQTRETTLSEPIEGDAKSAWR